MRTRAKGSLSVSQRLLSDVADDLRADVRDETVPTLKESITKATRGIYRFFWHNLAIIEALSDVLEGRCKRLMVFIPPRHSKSMTVQLFVAHLLRYFPGKRVIYATYGDSLARKASKAVQLYFKRLGGEFDHGGERANLSDWGTDSGGGMKSGGIGAGLTGEGGDVLILDDSVKDARAAQSNLVQQNNWEWFMSTFMTRQNPSFEHAEESGAAVILVQTLWSEDDIPERVIAIEREMAKSEDMKEFLTPWRVICFPAIFEKGLRTWPDHFTVVPDQRRDGEPLCEKINNLKVLLARRAQYYARGVAWQWHCLFQQDTTPRVGVHIQASWLKPYVKRDEIPNLSRWFRAWDLAFTPDGGDRTVSILCAIGPDRTRYVIPTTSVQCGPADVRETIKRVALGDEGVKHVGIERAHAGLAIIDDLKRDGPLKGVGIYESVPRRDKLARASNWISLARAGRIKLVAESPAEYILAEELLRSWTRFKGEDGDFDDWVDAMSIVDEMVSQVYGEQEPDEKKEMTPIEYLSYIRHAKPQPADPRTKTRTAQTRRRQV